MALCVTKGYCYIIIIIIMKFTSWKLKSPAYCVAIEFTPNGMFQISVSSRESL